MTLKTLQLSSTGKTVCYRDDGKGNVVVLLHGVGLQSAAWEPQIEKLSSTHRVVAIDLPGHGGSDPLPSNSALPAFVDWCHEVIVDLQLENVHLIGHSMGALIAGGYATTYKNHLKSVALLNGVFKRDPKAIAAVKERVTSIRQGDIDPQPQLNRWFTNSPEESATRGKVDKWLRSVDPEGYANAYAAFAEGDATYAERFTEIVCPLLALTGDGDPNSTPEMAKAMATAAPHGQAAVIEGHRHMLNLTAPNRVNELLLDWFRQVQVQAQVQTKELG